jgi:hypothetical protein
LIEKKGGQLTLIIPEPRSEQIQDAMDQALLLSKTKSLTLLWISDLDNA